MNIGAIGGYSPTSYINPYAMSAASSETGSPLDKVNGVEGASAVKGKSVDKTETNQPCQTCANRKYQDGSNENVSFKAPTNIAPEAAASAVRGHEQEHVANAYDKAARDNGKVISATVQIHTSCCPECGKTYVSGGTTRTSIKYTNENNPYQKNLKNMQGGFLRGINLDMKA